MHNFQKQIPENTSYELIIVGGGPAGCAAAIAAAREGTKTLLVERSSCLGGMSSGGRVPHWHGNAIGRFYPARGISELMMQKMQSKLSIDHGNPVGFAIDAEYMKGIFDEEVSASGADVLFETNLAAAETDDNGNIQYIILSNKSGLTAYKAKVYLDCTGDADLINYAGGEFEFGDEEGGVQAVTLCFMVTGIKGIPFDFKVRANDKLINKEDHFTYSWTAPGVYCINGGHIHMKNPLDPVERSQALMEGRRIARRITEALRESYPDVACEVRLAATADQLGVRESRRIVGDYKLTIDDYFSKRTFPDEIARNCSNLDTHETPREKRILDAGGTLPYKLEDFVYAEGDSHGIPYRSLTPKKLKNVAVAGRSLCADRRMMGSCRMMSVCMSMGESMGIAASLAAGMDSPDYHKVDVSRLQQLLIKHNAFLQV